MREDAHRLLAPQFSTILDAVEAPFFTPIYDHASPAMAVGRAAMVGDAAFVARPHVGAGVTKAAQDAQALCDCLAAAETVEAGLQAYHDARHQADMIAYKRGQHMGEYMVPKYETAEQKAEWANEHNIDTIMRDTAVMNYY
ncbi:FAD-dependent monooxygenase [Yoonia algicola]|uniref:FAD-dependent monooxygenase n=1 Tax=Yoonia algicola TaxID=3137368 RepID=A0AAN0M7L7_9RHOB